MFVLCLYSFICDVVFKQNTSYLMRISYLSSDVCSSDLGAIPQFFGFDLREFGRDIMVGSDDIARAVLLQSVLGLNVHDFPLLGPFGVLIGLAFATSLARRSIYLRSEERRVGKECVSTFRSRWSRIHKKKKK